MELLVVITIIAVLAAVSIPQVIGVIQRAQDVAIRTSMRVMLTEATRISILEGDLSRIHCNTGGHPDILVICDTVRAHSPHPAQLRSSATSRTFWIRAPLHDGTFWRVDHTGFAGRDLAGYVARWDMDEGSDQVVGDATGTNPGTRGPTTTLEPQDPTWAVGYLTFDGANDFIQVPDSASLDIAGNTITMEAWVRPAANVAEGMIINKDGSYQIALHNSVFRAAIETVAAGAWGWGGSQAVSLNVWSHLVFVYDGTNWNFYINGVLRETIPPVGGQTGNILPSVYVLKISNRVWIPSHFNGSVDNVRIYNRALTAEEVRISFLRGR